MDPHTWSKKVEICNWWSSRGHPRKTWLECIRNDLKIIGFEALLAKNRIA